MTEIVKSDAAKAQRNRVGLGNKSVRGELVSGQDGRRLNEKESREWGKRAGFLMVAVAGCGCCL